MMNKRERIHHEHTLGDKTAELISRHLGSWPFVFLQTGLVLFWIMANAFLLTRHPFDPFPFVFLNLVLAAQATYTAPILQMSANRIQKLDHKRDQIEAEEVEQLLDLIKEIQSINKRQLEILEVLGQELS